MAVGTMDIIYQKKISLPSVRFCIIFPLKARKCFLEISFLTVVVQPNKDVFGRPVRKWT